MANRSYLFAADAVPSGILTAKERTIIGISEWAYDIPVAFLYTGAGLSGAGVVLGMRKFSGF